MRNIPPIMETHFRYLEMESMYLVARENRSAIIRNGIASPREKTARRNPPCIAVADVPASRRTEPKIGPTQGVQPNANVPPIKRDDEGLPSVSHLGIGIRLSL